MSDRQLAPGWWQASDGRWYPPETHPNAAPPGPPSYEAQADGYYAPGAAPGAGQGNGLAVTALVLGIVAAVFGLIPLFFLISLTCGVLAVIFGLVGRDRPTRRGMALAGVLLGIAGVALAIIGVVIIDDAIDDVNGALDRGHEISSNDAAATGDAASGPESSTSPAIEVVGAVHIPEGTLGELDVVLLGPEIDETGSLPVVVRNNTSSSVYNLEATGTARGPDGSLAGSGTSQGFEPATLEPGEWAFGYVYFGAAVPDGTQFDISATADTEPGFAGSLSASPTEVNVVPGQFGGQQVVGIVTNETGEEMSGPVSVNVACFDQAGSQPLIVHIGYADTDSIPAGGSSSFTVDLFDGECPNFAVGASGFSF